jgi:hypothetical protein
MCAKPSAPPPSSAIPMAGRPGGCTAGRAEPAEEGAGFACSCAVTAVASNITARRIAGDFQRTGTPPGEKPGINLTLFRGDCRDVCSSELLLASERGRVIRIRPKAQNILPGGENPSASQARSPVRRTVQSYFGGGAGVKTSRLCAGSGLGFGLGAFLTSFLPLSLLPMVASVP